jgi:hypothetical protein
MTYKDMNKPHTLEILSQGAFLDVNDIIHTIRQWTSTTFLSSCNASPIHAFVCSNHWLKSEEATSETGICRRFNCTPLTSFKLGASSMTETTCVTRNLANSSGVVTVEKSERYSRGIISEAHFERARSVATDIVGFVSD